MTAAAGLTPLETLFEVSSGEEIPLPEALSALYGPLRLPSHPDRPHVASNFVTTLDGVISLNAPGMSGGGEISGFNAHDRAVMGLLRAVADAVVAGAGTLRAVPRHLWTAEQIYPPLADTYRQLRAALGKPPAPLNVIVTARAELDLELPVFASGAVPTLVVTTEQGGQRLAERQVPPSTRVAAVGQGARARAREMLAAIDAPPGGLVLVEGGPNLLADFLDERCLDELFLTLAPQVAGRDDGVPRPALVEGRLFAPAAPLWSTLASARRADSHLFLRYAFAAES